MRLPSQIARQQNPRVRPCVREKEFQAVLQWSVPPVHRRLNSRKVYNADSVQCTYSERFEVAQILKKIRFVRDDKPPRNYQCLILQI